MIKPGYILLAEDQEVDVFLLKRAFRQAGLPHTVINVPDGEKAVNYLKGYPPFDDRAKYPFPQLLVLDLKMPKVNGFDVLAWMAGRPDMSHLPVVVLTSSPLDSDVRMSHKLGARQFLTKPNDLEDMVTIAKSLSENWLTEADTPETLRNVSSGSLSWTAVSNTEVPAVPPEQLKSTGSQPSP